MLAICSDCGTVPWFLPAVARRSTSCRNNWFVSSVSSPCLRPRFAHKQWFKLALFSSTLSSSFSGFRSTKNVLVLKSDSFGATKSYTISLTMVAWFSEVMSWFWLTKSPFTLARDWDGNRSFMSYPKSWKNLSVVEPNGGLQGTVQIRNN